MKYTIRAILMIGVGIGVLTMAEDAVYAQDADPNAAPNPYKMQESWAQLPNGQKFGAAIKVQVDHSDGKSLWVFDRCGASECTDTTIPPIALDSTGRVYIADRANNRIQIFEPNGKLIAAWKQFGRPSDVAIDRIGTT